MLRGHFFLNKKGVFSKNKRALLCLLPNLREHVPPVPPGSYDYELVWTLTVKICSG